MSEMPYKYVQTIVSTEEAQEIDDYIRQYVTKSKREWLREVILKEVRKDGGNNAKSLPLH